MIRGVVGVIPHHSMETGRFYMAPNRAGNWLFQCVQTDEAFEGSYKRKGLFFTTGDQVDLGLSDLPWQSPVLALDEVHVRIDPTSLADSIGTTSLERGMFILDGDTPLLCAPDGFRGWSVVDLSTGRTSAQRSRQNWLSFTRWSLVMDDEHGDELTIASFGRHEP